MKKCLHNSIWFLGVLYLVISCTFSNSLAQDESSENAAPDSTAIAEVLGESTAMVVLRSQELFVVHGESIVSAQDRADALSEAILAVAESVKLQPKDLRVVNDERITASLIMCGRVFLGAVWEYEAEALGVNAEDLANERMEIIRAAIVDYRNDFSSGSMIKGII